jgi:hypothetical protein
VIIVVQATHIGPIVLEQNQYFILVFSAIRLVQKIDEFLATATPPQGLPVMLLDIWNSWELASRASSD